MNTIKINNDTLYNNILTIANELKEDRKQWIMAPYLYRIATPTLREDRNGSRVFLCDNEWSMIEVTDDSEKFCNEVASYFSGSDDIPKDWEKIKDNSDTLVFELTENHGFTEVFYEDDIKYELYFLTRKKAEDFLEKYKHLYPNSYVFQESFKNDDLANIFNFLIDIVW